MKIQHTYTLPCDVASLQSAVNTINGCFIVHISLIHPLRAHSVGLALKTQKGLWSDS